MLHSKITTDPQTSPEIASVPVRSSRRPRPDKRELPTRKQQCQCPVLSTTEAEWMHEKVARLSDDGFGLLCFVLSVANGRAEFVMGVDAMLRMLRGVTREKLEMLLARLVWHRQIAMEMARGDNMRWKILTETPAGWVARPLRPDGERFCIPPSSKTLELLRSRKTAAAK